MFLINRRADADRSPFGDFWFSPVGTMTSAGARVTAESALRLSAVFACVRVLAETMASLPVYVYRDTPGGGKEILRDHWLAKLLKKPNRWQNGFEFREMLQGHLALRGNSYCRILSNGRGEIMELIPIAPDSVKIEVFDSGEYRYKITKRDGSTEPMPRGAVWHLKGLSSDGIIGLSPLELARESFGAALAAQDYAGRFFANDARPGSGWIEFPGSFKDKAARSNFTESWQDKQTGANRHKIAVLEHGMKYHEVGVTNKDAQFIELRKFQVTDVARIYRVPPHMIGDLERSTNNNIEHQGLEFVTNTMTPWAERWEAGFEDGLLFEDGIEVEHDFTGLMRGDAASRAAYYQSGIQNGWMVRNEARISENLNPIEGLDEPLEPLNMADAGSRGKPKPKPAQDGADPNEDGADQAGDQEKEARLRSIVRAQAQRLARRIEKAGVVDEKEIRVIADALAVPIEKVTAWAKQPRTEQPSVESLSEELETL